MSQPFISRPSGASHPLSPGGIYLGTIVGVSGRTLKVSVPHIGLTVETTFAAARTPKEAYRKGDQVFGSFMNLEKNEFAVLGHVNRNWDVFTLQTYSNALAARITTLESTVESLQEQIDALTTALAGKANTGHSH